MNATYPATLRSEPEGGYTVLFPDLEGCITYGEDLKHALAMAHEALGLYLVSLEEYGHVPPHPSDIASVSTNTKDQVNLIKVNVNNYRRSATAMMSEAV